MGDLECFGINVPADIPTESGYTRLVYRRRRLRAQCPRRQAAGEVTIPIHYDSLWGGIRCTQRSPVAAAPAYPSHLFTDQKLAIRGLRITQPTFCRL